MSSLTHPTNALGSFDDVLLHNLLNVKIEEDKMAKARFVVLYTSKLAVQVASPRLRHVVVMPKEKVLAIRLRRLRISLQSISSTIFLRPLAIDITGMARGRIRLYGAREQITVRW